MQQLTAATSSSVSFSFSMISFTTAVHLAVGDDESGSLNYICVGNSESDDPQTIEHAPVKIKMKYQCPACERLGMQHQFPKGQLKDEGYVIVPKATQDQAKDSAAAFKKDAVVTAHPAGQVTAALMPSGKSYYLVLRNAGDAASEAYATLASLIRARGDLAFMTRLTLRSAVSLFRLEVAGDGVLLLRQMADAELVRQPPVAPRVDLTAREMDILFAIADQRTVDFDAVEHGIADKDKPIAAFVAAATALAAGDVKVKEQADEPRGAVLSLIEKLEASLASAKAGKASKAPARRAPARKGTAAKKTAAQKLAAQPAPVAPPAAVVKQRATRARRTVAKVG